MMDPTLMLHCNLCNVGVTTYVKWIGHLTTERHQLEIQQELEDASFSEDCSLDDDPLAERTIVVSGIPTTVPLLEVAKYFSNWGNILNLIYRGMDVGQGDEYLGTYPEAKMMFEIVYDQIQSVNELMSTQDIHCIENQLVSVRRKDGSNQTFLQSGQGQPFVGKVVGIVQPMQVKIPTAKSSNSSLEKDSSEKSKRAKLECTNKSKSKTSGDDDNIYKNLIQQVKEDLMELKVEEQVDCFYQLLCCSSDQLRKRDSVGSQLLNVLTQKFTECAVYPYGLDCIEIATSFDTMNVSIDPYGKLTDNGSLEPLPDTESGLTLEVYELLKKEQYNLKFCRDVEIKQVPWAFSDTKIQKISFVHKDSGITCNLMVENFIVVQEARLLKFLSTLDPRIKSLLFIVRYFAAVHNLLETPDETSKNQSMIWLLIHYLVMKSLVPMPHVLYSLRKTSLIVNNTNLAFCNDNAVVKHPVAPCMDDPNIRSLSVLNIVKNFFEYYATVDLKVNVVSPTIGNLIPVRAFGIKIGEDFPRELRIRYLLNENGTLRKKRFFSGSPMGLQDPLDLTVNLTKNVSLEEVSRFQRLCTLACKMLEDIMESDSGQFTDIFTDLAGKKLEGRNGNVALPMMGTSFEIDDESSSDEESVEVVKPEEPEIESSVELDNEPEDEDDEDRFECIRKGRIRLNQPVRTFFEKAVREVLPEEEISTVDLLRKFQTLWIQYLIEFNSRFWSECFGFLVEPVSGHKLSPAQYSQTGEDSKLKALKEKFDSISVDEAPNGLEYRCSLEGQLSNLLYKKKLWKNKYIRSQIRPLWVTLTADDASQSASSSLKEMVKISSDRVFEFKCKVEIVLDMREEFPVNAKIGTSCKLDIIDESYGCGKKNRAAKLRFLVNLYEKLASKYINRRIKQWLSCCKELDYLEFDKKFKVAKKKKKGHPKWRKFRKKWEDLGLALK